MKLLKKLHCWWYGHDWDDPYNMGAHCARCGGESEYEPMAYNIGGARWKFNEWKRRWKHWFTCPHCGLHCGHHNQECEDIPF